MIEAFGNDAFKYANPQAMNNSAADKLVEVTDDGRINNFTIFGSDLEGLLLRQTKRYMCLLKMQRLTLLEMIL